MINPNIIKNFNIWKHPPLEIQVKKKQFYTHELKMKVIDIMKAVLHIVKQATGQLYFQWGYINTISSIYTSQRKQIQCYIYAIFNASYKSRFGIIKMSSETALQTKLVQRIPAIATGIKSAFAPKDFKLSLHKLHLILAHQHSALNKTVYWCLKYITA